MLDRLYTLIKLAICCGIIYGVVPYIFYLATLVQVCTR